MAEIHPGEVIDRRYQVSRLIGSGGMASVFEVQDLTSGRRCAMKVLHRQMLLHPVIPQRFLREARAASVLDTPFAVKVEGTGNMADGSPYIVMELLEGLPLHTVIERQGPRFEAERALYLADQIAQGLADAHAHGIIHRDLKPENIFVIPTPQGDLVKVVDFGISKIFSGDDGVKLTQTGVTVGTPQYMPVEQLRGTKDLDGRVDVYALGVVLYEMLAGLRPYDGFTYEEVILKVASTTAPSLGTYRADLPPGLVGVVDRAMARNRAERIGSMAQLRQEMAPFWSGRSPLAASPSGAPGSMSALGQTGGHAATLGQTGGHPASLGQTGGQPVALGGVPSVPRASAGRTQVLERPSGPTTPSPPAAAPAQPPPPTPPPPPARTLPDHEALPAAPSPGASAQAASLVSPTNTRSGPPKVLVLVLVLLAAALLLLLIGIGVASLWLLV
jgi:serine/threonine-protein kinase